MCLCVCVCVRAYGVCFCDGVCVSRSASVSMFGGLCAHSCLFVWWRVCEQVIPRVYVWRCVSTAGCLCDGVCVRAGQPLCLCLEVWVCTAVCLCDGMCVCEQVSPRVYVWRCVSVCQQMCVFVWWCVSIAQCVRTYYKCVCEQGGP